MKIACVICEYNPFHSGHMAHIDMTRRVLGDECAVICIMSGNFTQRGEPAIMEKHRRAECGIYGGADLILEIPVIWSVSSAERFAKAGVFLAASLGQEVYLSFGSECGEIIELENVADILCHQETQDAVKEAMKNGLSYAAARESVLREQSGGKAEIVRYPNNILGIEYIKAIKSLHADNILPITFKRAITEHDGETKGNMAPAYVIRHLLMSGRDVSDFVPPHTLSAIDSEYSKGTFPVSVSNIESAILYKLRAMTENDYASLPDCGEGLDKRLYRIWRNSGTIDEALNRAKTKRYAMSRLRRIMMCAILEITADEQNALPPYIRVLAFNERGRSVLHALRKTAKKPVIIKPASVKKMDKQILTVFNRESFAGDIYSLMYPSPENRRSCYEWTKSPLYVNKSF